MLAPRTVRVTVNLAAAACWAWFAQSSFAYYVHTHRLIGGLYFVEQAWIVGAFLLRRPARTVSPSLSSWLLAAGGTFAALLFRPDGTMAAVVGPDGKIDLKKITVGRDFGNSLEVLQGIDAADRVVINPPDALEQGEPVNLAPEAAPGSAAPRAATPSKP